MDSIETKLISARDLIDYCKSFIALYRGSQTDKVRRDELYSLIGEIYNMPHAEPEIIRCRDCVYSHMTYGGDCKNCDKWEEMYESGESLYLKGDFFCGFGERKTDD